MGVSGAGKSTVAAALAARLGGRFLDADDLHPSSNVEKMRAGIPLDDDDRMPWLRVVGETLAAASATGEIPVIACSALRRRYRDVIRAAAPDAFFVLLQGTPELLAERMGARPGHFMPASLLASQLATLEPPQPDEAHLTVSSERSPDEESADVVARLGLGAVR